MLLCLSPYPVQVQGCQGGGCAGVFIPQASKHYGSGALSPEDQLLSIASTALDKLLITHSLGSLVGTALPQLLCMPMEA